MIKQSRQPLFLLTGGGTAGSVTPLLAIAEALRKNRPELQLSWLGTVSGPEKILVEEAGIDFRAISSGKFRRYWSIANFIDLFRIIKGFGQAVSFIYQTRPKLVISAGSFVSVPVVWAAKFFRVPVVIEQLDYRPGLANKLMSVVANEVLVTFEKSCQDYGAKAVWLGAPVREDFYQVNQVIQMPWKFLEEKPVVLVFGGGTGAAGINQLIDEQLIEITRVANVIHLTGKGKGRAENNGNYYQTDFLEQKLMFAAYHEADLVIARAGLGTLIELAAFKKASLIIPMPNSHQIENAQVIKEAGAALVFAEKELANGQLNKQIEKVIDNKTGQAVMTANWPRVIKIADSATINQVFEKYF